MQDTIQRELDIAEEYILTRLIGDINSPIFGNTVKMFAITKNIDLKKFINHYIEVFETFARNTMYENGYVDGNKLKNILSVKFPALASFSIPDFRPIELAVLLDQLFNLNSIGRFIQKI
jgi:hypothetical protein